MSIARRIVIAVTVGVPLIALVGCGGRGQACEDNARYWNAPSGIPLRIPDDLSVPDQSRGITVPPGQAGSRPQPAAGECLELPPGYFEEGGSEVG